jgi:hypothetical protein
MDWFKKVAHMKYKILYLSSLLLILLYGCHKDGESFTPIELQKRALIGVGTPIYWKLTTYYSDNVLTPLTYSQQKLEKSYTADGKFTTTDGFTGTWDIPVLDYLVEIYSNTASSVPINQGYTITNLSSNKVELNYKINGVYVKTIFSSHY